MTNNIVPINTGRRSVTEMEKMPDWVYDVAYQLWAYVHSQNGSKVSRSLLAADYEDEAGIIPDDALIDGEIPPVTITPQAVNKWAREKGWESRRVTELRELAPALHQKVASNLNLRALEAEKFLSDYMNGRIIPKDATEAKTLDSRAKVAQAFLDRAGHLPHTKQKDGSLPTAPQVDHRKSIAGMSMEERLEKAWGKKEA